MKSRFLLLILILALVIIPSVIAKSGTMSLLTVSGTGNESFGDIAEVVLEIKPGTGKIFIDSFPLSKVDTQISTRYANQIACDYLKKDCTRYNFYYTIRAKASIVGGPSAGAAITVLTISVLSDTPIDDKTLITGTINSGNMIGPVAGLDKKIGAAIKNNFNKVIVPKWQSDLNITEIEEEYPFKEITLVKVRNLDEVMYHFTGKAYNNKVEEIVINEEYTERMKEVAEALCLRSFSLRDNLGTVTNNSIYDMAGEFLNRSEHAYANKTYYAMASYCFSANLRYKHIETEDWSKEQLFNAYDDISSEIFDLKQEIDAVELKTLSDLETYIIVNERLAEAGEFLSEVNWTNVSAYLIAYAQERLYSGKVWTEFFGMSGSEFKLDEAHLRNICLKKAAEAEERVNYVALYLPSLVENIKEDLQEAYNSHDKGDYPRCIFKSSKAKAEANIIMSALTIQEEEYESMLSEKHESIKKIIAELQTKDIFPIMGYSYFEYSKSLEEYDLLSSLTFAEYALEISRLDFYFPEDRKYNIWVEFDLIKLFLFGFIVGAGSVYLFFITRNQRKRFKKP